MSSECSLMSCMICCFLLFPVFWGVHDVERDTPENFFSPFLVGVSASKNQAYTVHANFGLVR